MLNLLVLRFLTILSFLTVSVYVDANETIVPESHILSVEGADLEARIWGSGEVVIAIPGLASDHAYYELVAPLIAEQGFSVVALNMRGVGKSTGSLDNLTLDTLAKDVSNAIQALSVERAHLLGWAFGNRVARAVAQNHPERVKTIILLAAGGLVPPSKEVNGAFQRLLKEPELDETTRIQLLRKTLYAPMSDVPALLETVQPGTWPEARAAQIASIQSSNVDDWWSGGNTQMLVIQGRYDVIAPAQNGLSLVEDYPERTKLVWVEDAGHMLLIEQPAIVAEYITEYLNGKL